MADRGSTSRAMGWNPWVGTVCVPGGWLYVSNPGAGVIEFVPAGARLVGNLREAVAKTASIVGHRWLFARSRAP